MDGGEWPTSCFSYFTPRVISPQHPLDRRLGGPQSQSGCSGEEKKIPSLLLLGIEPWLFSPVSTLIEVL